MSFNIAIDGPSGAGKSSVSKAVSKKLGFIYVDTGALYRTVGLYIYNNGIDPDNTQSVISALDKISVKFDYINGEQHVFLNDTDVTEEIRMHAISEYASKVSAITKVREFLLFMQRDIASKNNVLMDGRDIGTVVLPDAQLKIFLTASAEVRAKRRCDELIQKGQEVDFNTVLNDIIERDKRDTERKIAPLKIAENAVVVDTSECTFDESVDIICNLVKESLK